MAILIRRGWLGRPEWVRAVFALAVTLALAPLVRSQQMHSELEVKAAYLFRIASYIDWPEPIAADRPFVIAVMGHPDLARELKKLAPGHLVREHVVQILDVTRTEELETARILIVGADRNDYLRSLNRNDPPGILIVTDEDHGIELGGMLNFVTIDDRVRFEISVTAAERAHLKVSADLLAIAIRVNGARRQSRIPRPPGAPDLATGYPRALDDESSRPA